MAETNFPNGSLRVRTVTPETKSKPQEREQKGKFVASRAKPEVKHRQENFFEKALRFFIDDDVDDIGKYALYEVIRPTAQRALAQFTNTLFLGKGSANTNSNQTPYHRITKSPLRATSEETSRLSEVSREIDALDLDAIPFDTEEQANDILQELWAQIDKNGYVSVAYLCDMIGEECTWTAEDYGWRNLRSASIKTRGGYSILRLPRPIRRK